MEKTPPATEGFACVPWVGIAAAPDMLAIHAAHTGSKVFSTIFLAPPDDDPIRFAGKKSGT